MGALDVALLSLLRGSAVHLPVGEIAAALRADPATVTAHVAELRAAGFDIENRPGLGFRLLAGPDRLIADDIRARLGPSTFVREVIVFEETDSTNQRAIDLGRSGARGGIAIFAERQTKGRGRFGRRWESASHLGLWFSVLLRPELPLAAWSRLTTWTAVAAAEAIDRETGIEVQIKWPNDLEIRGAKLAGILIEIMPDDAGEYFAVVGIGLNLNHEAADFPDELRGRATSLRLTHGSASDRNAVAAAILRSMESNFPRLADPAFSSLVAEATHRSALLGRRIVLDSAGMRLEGLAEALAPDGRLVLRLDSGATEVVSAGEASVVTRNVG